MHHRGGEKGLLQMTAYSKVCFFEQWELFIASIYSRENATLHVDCHDTNNNKKDIQVLTMTFNLPYFLVYQGTFTRSGSVELSSVRNNTGRLVFQVSNRSKSDVFKFCNTFSKVYQIENGARNNPCTCRAVVQGGKIAWRTRNTKVLGERSLDIPCVVWKILTSSAEKFKFKVLGYSWGILYVAKNNSDWRHQQVT